MEGNIDEFFMGEALKQAQYAFEKGEVPIGAVLVANGKIFSRAHNQTELLSDPTAHAEMLVIGSATSHLQTKYLKQCTLYVTVEPCPMCAGAAFWSQIGRIVYGTLDPKRGFQRFSSKILHPKTILKGGVLELACSDLMEKFFKSLR